MFCRNCGSQLEDNAKFCVKCGSSLENTVEVQPMYEPTVINAVPLEQAAAVGIAPKKEPNKAVMGILSVLICIFIFVFSFAAIAILGFRGSIKSENVENMIEEIDIKMLIDSSDEMQELVYKSIDEDDVEEIYKKSTIEDYIKSIVTGYTDYILGGDEPRGVDSDDIIDLMEDNAELIKEEGGYELKEEDYEKVEESFDENLEDDLGIFSEDAPFGNTFKTIRVFSSKAMVTVLISITLLLFVVMFTVARQRFNALIWTGITYILSSAVFVVFGTVQSIVLGFIPDKQVMIEEFVGLYLSNSLWSFLAAGGIFAAVGVVLIVVAVVAKSIKKALDTKKA